MLQKVTMKQRGSVASQRQILQIGMPNMGGAGRARVKGSVPEIVHGDGLQDWSCEQNSVKGSSRKTISTECCKIWEVRIYRSQKSIRGWVTYAPAEVTTGQGEGSDWS